jgi:hypothetical protein
MRENCLRRTYSPTVNAFLFYIENISLYGGRVLCWSPAMRSLWIEETTDPGCFLMKNFYLLYVIHDVCGFIRINNSHHCSIAVTDVAL